MQRHYTMQKTIMAIAIIAVIALVILNLMWKDGPEPDAVYPFANVNIDWNQSYHYGSFID